MSSTFGFQSFSSSAVATQYPLSVGIVVLGVLFWLSRILLSSDRKRLPPGPRGLPIIGNLHQAPRKGNAWEAYKEWSDKYGPIMSIRSGNQISIIITSHDIVQNFLEKNNSVFSSRPQLAVLEHALKGFTTPSLPYGDKWLSHRAMRAAVLKSSMVSNYRGLQDLESKQLMYELLHDEDFTKCLRRHAISLILGIAYGQRVPQAEVVDIDEAVRQLGNTVEVMFSGTAMLREFFPILKLLPGSEEWRKQVDEVGDRLADIYVDRFRAGLQTPAWNWTKAYLRRPEAEEMDELELAFCIGSSFQASLTPHEIIRIIMSVAIFHPEETAKLQSELDRVVGDERLPDWDDNLPFTNAFITESLRWRSFSPLGAPRAATRDIEYKGYLIPKGATVIINQWAMDHDENVYGDPFVFRPQRWIDNPDLPHFPFGYGLRRCPGQFLAKDFLFLNTARLFWAYNIGRPVENGKEVDLDLAEIMKPRRDGSGFNQVPPFKASIIVRNVKRQEVFKEAWETAEKDEQRILADAMLI